jgi:hypothetical protein
VGEHGDFLPGTAPVRDLDAGRFPESVHPLDGMHGRQV